MLSTVDDVIERLGGTMKTAEIAGVLPSAVSNWRTRQLIPSDKYLSIKRALTEIGCSADPKVFSFQQQASA